MNKIWTCGMMLSVTLLSSAFGKSTYDDKIDALMQKMTLEEKLGQLTQYSSRKMLTGVANPADIKLLDEVRSGRVGSFLNIATTERIKEVQRIAVEESRLGIPLVFAMDVIHGYRTIFPVPLAEAASWDETAVELSAHIAATEAAATGLNWTFAPMVDVARDPRWGRVVEGSGEDPYLGSRIAVARVKGFQGDDLSKPDTILACTKHFAAYSAAEGGRDYNTADISLQTLYDIHFPPFKATVDAGVATFMSSFNELNGVPATGSKFLMTDVLRDDWGFEGFVVSDWGSIKDMVKHGNVETPKDSAEVGLNAGVDMDMESSVYIDYVESLIAEKRVDIKTVDQSVRRILMSKFELGLFDDPYRYCDAKREKEMLLNEKHLAAARDVAKRSIILLKNQEEVLPLKKTTKTIAVVGALANSKDDPIGCWGAKGESKDSVSVLAGIQAAVSKDTEVLYAEGCWVKRGKDRIESGKRDFDKALEIARKADVVIAVIGEHKRMTGEAASRGELTLPGDQMEMIQELKKTGTPVVAVLMNGRPLELEWIDENIPAIVETWYLGTQMGHAVADVLFGDYNPAGKLPLTWPRRGAQIPLFYNRKNTGKPPSESFLTSKYIDIPFGELYPFGYGLSYTTFEYGAPSLNKSSVKFGEELELSVPVKNTGKRAGEEIVQLYVRDLVGSVTRPLKELKGFEKISLQPGEEKIVTLKISSEDLKFCNERLEFNAEAGKFHIFVGPNSRDLQQLSFALVK